MRFNVNKKTGERTTVRIPPELWEIFVIVIGADNLARSFVYRLDDPTDAKNQIVKYLRNNIQAAQHDLPLTS